MGLGTAKSPVIAYKGSVKNQCWAPPGSVGWESKN